MGMRLICAAKTNVVIVLTVLYLVKMLVVLLPLPRAQMKTVKNIYSP